MICIEGSKVRLRDWRLEDADATRFWERPGHRWQELDGPYYRGGQDDSEAEAGRVVARVLAANEPDPRMNLVIADPATDELRGYVSSYWQSQETNWLCVGLVLYDEATWGKGVGREALSLWMDYLFAARPELVRLDLRTWSGNTGMIALAEKLGYRREAVFRRARIVRATFYDGLGYGILREEWMNRGREEEPVIGGVYEHYKGKRYRVYGVCRHSETLEELVHYECLYENELGKMWVRPKELFLGAVTIGDRTLRRFRYVGR